MRAAASAGISPMNNDEGTTIMSALGTALKPVTKSGKFYIQSVVLLLVRAV